eukprot:7857988-Heterocapsa_arctica.AAC.1
MAAPALDPGDQIPRRWLQVIIALLHPMGPSPFRLACASRVGRIRDLGTYSCVAGRSEGGLRAKVCSPLGMALSLGGPYRRPGEATWRSRLAEGAST